MDFNEDEEITKTKGKMYAITTLSVIAVIIIFVIMSILSINAFFSDLSKNVYYVFEVNNDSKDYIIDIIEEEKENYIISEDKMPYCNSIYKIEYWSNFIGSQSITVYCNDEDDIQFGIDDDFSSKLVEYIKGNGIREKR